MINVLLLAIFHGRKIEKMYSRKDRMEEGKIADKSNEFEMNHIINKVPLSVLETLTVYFWNTNSKHKPTHHV